MATDYKKDFDDSVRNLVHIREEILGADSLMAVAQKEREVQQALFAIQHFSMRLANWMQDAAIARRKELNDMANREIHDIHDASKATEPVKQSKKRTYKRKKKEEK